MIPVFTCQAKCQAAWQSRQPQETPQTAAALDVGYSPVPWVDYSAPASNPSSASQPLPAPIPGPTAPHTVRNIILAIAGALIIIVALGIGGAIYVGMKVKEKATSIAEKITSSPSASAPDADNATDPGHGHSDAGEQALNGLASLLQGKQDTDKGDDVPTISKSDPVVPCTA